MSLEHGEAHFTVAKNPNRPFIVSAAGVDVRAVGTQFDVRLSSSELHVLVTEGQVKVGPIPLVSAGEEAVIPLGPGAAPAHVEPASRSRQDAELNWRPQTLEFNGAPLSQYVAAFNQHNAVTLVVVDPSLAELRISARLRSDNIAGFVRLLESGFDIRAERTGQTILLRKGP